MTEAAEASRLRAALAAKPDGVLEEVAAAHEARLGDVLAVLADGQAVAVAGAAFERIWSALTTWGPVMLILHTRDGVFECAGAVPPGTSGRGYFNVRGESPIGGHIRADRCARIVFVDRPFFGRRSCSLQFISVDGDAMFKIFVRRGTDRELDPAQLAMFEKLRQEHMSIDGVS